MRAGRTRHGTEASPWAWGGPGGGEWLGAAARLEEVRRSLDGAWLRQVMGWRDGQAAVRAAAERRLRELARRKAGKKQ